MLFMKIEQRLQYSSIMPAENVLRMVCMLRRLVLSHLMMEALCRMK